MVLKYGHWSTWQKIESDYWDTTYRELNPFMPPIVCHECGEKPEKSRWRDAEIAPVTEYEFKCAKGHTWQTRKTYD